MKAIWYNQDMIHTFKIMFVALLLLAGSTYFAFGAPFQALKLLPNIRGPALGANVPSLIPSEENKFRVEVKKEGVFVAPPYGTFSLVLKPCSKPDAIYPWSILIPANNICGRYGDGADILIRNALISPDGLLIVGRQGYAGAVGEEQFVSINLSKSDPSVSSFSISDVLGEMPLTSTGRYFYSYRVQNEVTILDFVLQGEGKSEMAGLNSVHSVKIIEGKLSLDGEN